MKRKAAIPTLVVSIFIVVSFSVFTLFSKTHAEEKIQSFGDSLTQTVATDAPISDTTTISPTNTIVVIPTDTQSPTEIPVTNTPIPHVLTATIQSTSMSCSGDPLRDLVNTPEITITNPSDYNRSFNASANDGFIVHFPDTGSQIRPHSSAKIFLFGSPQANGTRINITIYEDDQDGLNIGPSASFTVTCS